MKMQEEQWIYHERQESALCGQHCLNNLLQGAYFTPDYLAEIAAEMDQLERQMMMEMGASTPDALRFLAEESGNVDNSGNFSIQVLNKAIERSHSVTLVNSASKSMREGDLLREEGFVCNRSSHWFTIRKLHDKYWNLNSTSERPEHISDFYLDAFLTQLRADGYSVFVANPTESLPQPPPCAVEGPEYPLYHRVSTLLAEKNTGSGGDEPVDPWSLAGSGYTMSQGMDDTVPGTDEDLDLARAMAMSMEDQRPPRQLEPLPSEPSEGERAVRMQLQGYSGRDRTTRKFRPDEPAFFIFDWAADHLASTPGCDASKPFDIIFSREVLDEEAMRASRTSFQDADLAPSAALNLRFK